MIADLLHKIAEFQSEETFPYSPRPSLAGPQRCIRQLDYYAQNYEKKPFPGRFITVLDDSSWHEQLIKDWIRKSAYQIHSEQMKVICGHVNGKNVIGHIDGIVTDMLGNDSLLEIKAISHFGFQDVWNGALPLDYIIQTCLYLRGLKEINPEICKGLLFMKNKNQSQYLEILIQYDLVEADVALVSEMILSTGERKEINITLDRVTFSAIEKFEEIEKFRQKKRLHDRQYKRENWHCNYCQYGELCWENWEEEFEDRIEESQLPSEYEDTLRFYLELNMHESEIKKQKEEIRDKILGEMKKLNCKKAVVGPYMATMRLQPHTSIDKDAPEELLRRCTKTTISEILNIRKRKEG